MPGPRAGRRTWRAGPSSAPPVSAGRDRTRSSAAACARPSPSGARRGHAATAATAASAASAATAATAAPGSRAPAVEPVATPGPGPAASRSPAFPDDWFLRRGPFERGAIHDTAWAAELDIVTRWLDGLPHATRIAEPGAGVGFFSPLLAARAELHASDPDATALDRARERLVAHRLLAHLHVADPWDVPAGDPVDQVDQVVAAFLLGRVRGAGLDPAVASLRARLRPGGTLAIVELSPDAAGGPPDGIAWTFHEPGVIEAAVARAGFADVRHASTGRFFLLVTATAD